MTIAATSTTSALAERRAKDNKNKKKSMVWRKEGRLVVRGVL
jgi:hypothetical protein